MSSESTDLTTSPATPPTTVDTAVGKPTGEAAVLAGVQSVLTNPTTVKAARGLSHFGEHSLGWLALAGAGAAIASRRGNETAQRRFIEAGVGAFGAHAASVIIKRIVRRPRPDHPAIAVGVGTPSKLSFPSSHATSTTAALVAMSRMGFGPAPLAGVPAIMLSRLVLGVHYPTDVLAGAALGWTTATITDKILGGAADAAPATSAGEGRTAQ